MKRLLILALLSAGTAATAPAAAQSCMAAPVPSKIVTSRFGIYRTKDDNARLGSGASRAHMHDGLDFTTGGRHDPVYAAAPGKVQSIGNVGGRGKYVIVKRDGSKDTTTYYHLNHIDVKRDQVVKQGDIIGRSGATGMGGKGAIHLHFIYAVPQKTDARAKAFFRGAKANKSFNPGQLPTTLKDGIDFGYATDPSPYFCETFKFQNNDDGLQGILGKDTKAQYAIIFGGTAPQMGVDPGNTEMSPVQVSAANTEALVLAAKGATTNPASVLTDSDGFGALPTAPIGDYETLSPAAMVSSEARRRFTDSEWNSNIVKVSSRALWLDYLRAVGVANYITELTRQKKERVEALLALYTSQKLAAVKSQAAVAQQRATSAEVKKAIK